MTFTRQVTRIAPQGPTHAYQTYAIRTGLDTHYRKATCAEIDCPDYLNGWYLKIEGTPQELLHIATHCGKRYRQGEVLIEGQTQAFKALIFEAGQPCFRESTHVKSLERPEFFYVGRGDYRSFTTRKAKLFDRPDQFVDSMQTELDKIRTRIERG